MISDDVFNWILLLVRWLHITVAVTWIGTSIFFMWLDRTLVFNDQSDNEGHVGDLWMVHGGGFYHVEKLLMGPTKVPEVLHWFKWESYWTWMSGVTLLSLIFYTGGGTFLLDDSVSNISYGQGVLIGIFSIIGSWFFYDFLWERKLTKTSPIIGHILTVLWLVLMSYFLCHTLAGRAAYIHIGAMIGTWMTANVFMRIIPRQLKMVEASKKGEEVNKEWGINAKNRSTHNTYFTLPIIFIMLSNHFPTSTYGHQYNWIILLLITCSGAAIREYFVKRVNNIKKAKISLILGILLLVFTINFTKEESSSVNDVTEEIVPTSIKKVVDTKEVITQKLYSISGTVSFSGVVPIGKKLRLPKACAKQFKGPVYSDEVKVHDGKLQNVLVRVTKGIEDRVFTEIPHKAVVVNQKGCIYSPRVSAVRVGQKVTFLNSDPVFHNIKSITKNNKKFNVAMPKKNNSFSRIFTKPEIFLQTKCNLHPWMGSYIAILDHPFFSVTNETGFFNIKNLPKGNYTLEFWHEVFGIIKKEIEVSGNDKEISLNIIFKAKN